MLSSYHQPGTACRSIERIIPRAILLVLVVDLEETTSYVEFGECWLSLRHKSLGEAFIQQTMKVRTLRNFSTEGRSVFHQNMISLEISQPHAGDSVI